MSQAFDVGDGVRIRGRFGTHQTRLYSESGVSATSLSVVDTTGYSSGDVVLLNPGAETEEQNTISGISGRTLTFSSAFIHPHHIREPLIERADPTGVTLKIKGPSGTTASYVYSTSSGTITRDAAGLYYQDISLSSAGDYYFRWEGTGAAEVAAESQFTVRRSQFAT